MEILAPRHTEWNLHENLTAWSTNVNCKDIWNQFPIFLMSPEICLLLDNAKSQLNSLESEIWAGTMTDEYIARFTKLKIGTGLIYTCYSWLTHWGRVTHICVVKPTLIGSDNGSSPGRRRAIIWTNAGILLIGPLGTNFIEISIGIQTFSFKKMHLKMSSAKWRPFGLGLNVLTLLDLVTHTYVGMVSHIFNTKPLFTSMLIYYLEWFNIYRWLSVRLQYLHC